MRNCLKFADPLLQVVQVLHVFIKIMRCMLFLNIFLLLAAFTDPAVMGQPTTANANEANVTPLPRDDSLNVKIHHNISMGTEDIFNIIEANLDDDNLRFARDQPKRGISKEEIAVYVCLGLAVLLVMVCCFCCCRHCCCPSTRRPTTIIYRQMTIPANLSIFTRGSDSDGLLIPCSSPMNFSPIHANGTHIMLDSLPTVAELYHRENMDQPPPYSASPRPSSENPPPPRLSPDASLNSQNRQPPDRGDRCTAGTS